ncbi:unnamed protein product [Phytophthora fragariaefolia]|uniref:Unnamed protein product n=1 Tax=Phytophthora fragariaefolia TaxID=1490495 RepID=A0A9W7CVU2_9STRA|nr:unnamed protein product [Phytophthora fragariaefolia]
MLLNVVSNTVRVISATVSTNRRNGAGEGSLGEHREHGYGAGRGRGVPRHEDLPMQNTLASGSASEDTDRPIEAEASTTGSTTTATRRETPDNGLGAACSRGVPCGRSTSRSRTTSGGNGSGRGRGGA